jgi:hypothetical protein
MSGHIPNLSALQRLGNGARASEEQTPKCRLVCNILVSGDREVRAGKCRIMKVKVIHFDTHQEGTVTVLSQFSAVVHDVCRNDVGAAAGGGAALRWPSGAHNETL